MVEATLVYFLWLPYLNLYQAMEEWPSWDAPVSFATFNLLEEALVALFSWPAEVSMLWPIINHYRPLHGYEKTEILVTHYLGGWNIFKII